MSSRKQTQACRLLLKSPNPLVFVFSEVEKELGKKGKKTLDPIQQAPELPTKTRPRKNLEFQDTESPGEMDAWCLFC